MLTLKHVAHALLNTPTPGDDSYPINRVVIDSRQVKAGDLFVAFAGEQADGHDYVSNAFANGAVAALVSKPVPGDYLTLTTTDNLWTQPQKPVCILVPDTLVALQTLAGYWRQRFPVSVIGITGSVGKTSTKELVALVLKQRFVTLKNRGNQNNEIGLPLTLLNLKPHHQRLVLEMGMYDLGEIAALCRLAQPTVGVVTNIGPSHLERLGTIDKIVQAKQELIESLPAHGTAILNIDDERVMQMQAHTQAKIFTYGLSDQADLWADNISSDGLEGIRFVLHHQGEALHLRVPLLGRHSVHTALRAAAVGLSQGLSWGEIIAGLQSNDSQTQLRLVANPGINGALLLDDTYNASPASSMAALDLLGDLDANRRIAVLGGMKELGSYEETGHRKVGCRAADIVDLLVTVGNTAQLIADEALACGLSAQTVHHTENNQAAINYLRQVITAGDTVLFKGARSMAMETIVAALSVNPQEKQG